MRWRAGAVDIVLAMLLGLGGGFLLGRSSTATPSSTPKEAPDAQARVKKAVSDPALATIHHSFTYHGQPIHPALIEEFSNWPSDPARSITVAVDITAAQETNEYNEPVQVGEEKQWVRYERQAKAGSFAYRWLGRLRDGTHVLRTANHGGGSGIFEDLVLVRFKVGRGYNPQPGQYQRLLMKAVGQISLGDRSGAALEMTPQRLTIHGAPGPAGSRVLRVDDLP